jgi:hypothetical protein
VGPHCSFCGTFTGPFSKVEGLFTVLICIACLEIRETIDYLVLGDTTVLLEEPAGIRVLTDDPSGARCRCSARSDASACHRHSRS